MQRFTPDNHAEHRRLAMNHTVSFHDVPMPRGLAFVLYDVERHGGAMFVWSVDRRIKQITAHNREFGTHLHAQQALIDAHARDPVHNAAANPVDRTSHCLRADGNPAYRDSRGKIITPGGHLRWWQIGGDYEDNDQDGRRGNDVNRILKISHELGYAFVQPYRSGSEGHHLVLVHDPIPVLERRHVIATNRSS